MFRRVRAFIDLMRAGHPGVLCSSAERASVAFMCCERPASVADGLSLKSLRRGALAKHFLTLWADTDGECIFRRLESAARGADGTLLSQMVLGGAHGCAEAAPRVAGADWPVTWLSGDPCRSLDPAGCQAVAVTGAPVRTLRLNGRVVGRVYEDDDAVYCHLGGILPADPAAPRAAQARSFFENMEAVLALAGMEFHHLVRTWLYLAHLLEWYDEFNGVRTAFFRERGVFERMVPASTGIGATNPSGSALIGDAVAVRPKTGRVRIAPVASPLQGPAMAYHSSFSRAAEVARPGLRELYISGTASIDEHGRTAHVGDPVAQIAFTMRVVDAILAARGMTWDDTVQGIAYFKDMAHLAHFRAWCEEHGRTDLPVACLHADVCRDELLFEIEVLAADGNRGVPA
jgi:enamine deaminase RidA (YjgF/YER057c/UK114 family)